MHLLLDIFFGQLGAGLTLGRRRSVIPEGEFGPSSGWTWAAAAAGALTTGAFAWVVFGICARMMHLFHDDLLFFLGLLLFPLIVFAFLLGLTGTLASGLAAISLLWDEPSAWVRAGGCAVLSLLFGGALLGAHLGVAPLLLTIFGACEIVLLAASWPARAHR